MEVRGSRLFGTLIKGGKERPGQRMKLVPVGERWLRVSSRTLTQEDKFWMSHLAGPTDIWWVEARVLL